VSTLNLEEEPGVEAGKAGGGEVEVQGGAVGDGVKPVDGTGEHARTQKAKAHHRRASVEATNPAVKPAEEAARRAEVLLWIGPHPHHGRRA
jgi:hypothetical protein